MITLLLDSSSRTMNIGIARDRKLIARHEENAFQTQSELFTLRIDELLSANNLSVQDVNEIVVTNGPGSFTGVRIAVTIAKVMAFARNIPLYTLSTLALFAHETKPTICVLDARNNRSFAGVYAQNNIIREDGVMLNDDVVALAQKEGYLISGETKHLNIESAPYDVFLNMLHYLKGAQPVSDIKTFKPRYLKG